MEIEEDDEDDSVAVEKGVQEDLEGSQEEESNFYPTMALAADGPHIATMVAAITNDMGMDVNIPTGVFVQEVRAVKKIEVVAAEASVKVDKNPSTEVKDSG
ncbi:hypothetical protein AMTR_s00011p00264350 [Amborella trichopoda]|uniref:Uncharacterized protein n=1 Tax=Amborella trichopoda TaxID=13333 RepID=W1NHV9_AMBTC|nr:hypothetical protein AMTR_s00011p00264350 [Amborella trichopoda]